MPSTKPTTKKTIKHSHSGAKRTSLKSTVVSKSRKKSAKNALLLLRPLKHLRSRGFVKLPSKRQTKKLKKLTTRKWFKPVFFGLVFGTIGCYLLVFSLAATDTASCTGPCKSIAGAANASDKYWIMGQDGGVFSINVPYYGSVPGTGTKLTNAVGMVSTPNQAGYYIYTTTGAVYAFGNASYKGGSPGASNVVAFALRPQNDGYWMFGRDGGVFAYGAAPFKNSLPGLNVHVNNVIGGAPTKSGNGYWMVGSDGGIFAFGDAQYFGSKGGQPLNAPIVAMEPTLSGNGYWLVASDGGVFAYGDAVFYGSLGSTHLVGPIVGIERTPSGKGYWMLGSDGGVFAYGDAKYAGRVKSTPPPPPPAPPKPPAPKPSSGGSGSSSGSRSSSRSGSSGRSGSRRQRSTSSSSGSSASDPCATSRQCQRESRDEKANANNNTCPGNMMCAPPRATNSYQSNLVFFNPPRPADKPKPQATNRRNGGAFFQ